MDVSNGHGNRLAYALDILIYKFLYFFYFHADYFYAIIILIDWMMSFLQQQMW